MIFSINHPYEVSKNKIFIQQALAAIAKDKALAIRPIGWIFRRNLDYVSLDYANGDWSRKFLWSCEVTPLEELEIRVKNKLNKLIKASDEKL